MSRSGPARGAAWKWLRSVAPQRRNLVQDLLAGVPSAVGSVPDGMAAAILAGVNPVQGLAGRAGVVGFFTCPSKVMAGAAMTITHA
jgi:SulP family sulfate permease